METFVGWLVEIGPDPEGEGLRVVLAIAKVRPSNEAPTRYELTVDPEDGSVIPDGELSECFEVLHESEDGTGLEPGLRRMWKIAHVADEIMSRLVSSRALGAISSDK